MKRALITSGGGAKGAFTVGALTYIFKNNLGDFDIISGSSTGALIAALAVIKDIETLRSVYTHVNNDDIIASTNVVRQLQQGKPYLLDTYPLKSLIQEKITAQVFEAIINSTTTLCVTAVSLQTGESTLFSTKEIEIPKGYNFKLIENLQQLLDALLASSSQGGFLPPVTIDGEQMIDGGHRAIIPLAPALAQNPDEVIVLSNNPRSIFPGKDKYKSVINVVLRVTSIFIQEIREHNYKQLEDYKEKTNSPIYYIEPDTDLDEQNSTGLRFDRFLMNLWMSQGELKAAHVFSNDDPVMPI